MEKYSQLPLFKYNSEPTVAAVILVHYLNRLPHILLGERINPKDRFTITVPGGKIRKGESPKRCAIRETREETGLIIPSVEELIEAGGDLVINPQTIIRYFFAFFNEACYDQEPVNMEPDKVTNWEWKSLRDLQQLELQQIYPLISQMWWAEEIIKPEYLPQNRPVGNSWIEWIHEF